MLPNRAGFAENHLASVMGVGFANAASCDVDLGSFEGLESMFVVGEELRRGNASIVRGS